MKTHQEYQVKMEAKYEILLFAGAQRPAIHPLATSEAATEREARAIAARMLGRASLRGCFSWDRYQGGTCYRFGARTEYNTHAYAVIVEAGDNGEGRR